MRLAAVSVMLGLLFATASVVKQCAAAPVVVQQKATASAEQMAQYIAARVNREAKPGDRGGLLVSTTARARGRYVFIESVLRMKADLSREERAAFRQRLLEELPALCKADAEAMAAGVVYIVTYLSTHGQEGASIRMGAEECP